MSLKKLLTKTVQRRILISLLIIAMVLTAYSQDPAVNPDKNPTETGVVSGKSAGGSDGSQAAVDENGEPLAVVTELQRRMQQEITLELRETPIDEALRLIAAQGDIDVVKSPQVTGNVSATLSDVPLDEALTNILAAHGYGYIASKNMIRVVPMSQIVDATEKIVDRVYRVTYADVEDVEDALKKFITKRGAISSNPGTNNILVADVESKIKAIDTFIEEIDRMIPQILVEARIYDVSSTDSLDLGIEWQAGRRTGYDNGVGTLGGVGSGVNVGHLTGAFNGIANNAENTTGILRFGFLTNSIDIDAIVRAEREDVEAKLLANPRILVLDNEEAVIKIVEEIPFQELTETAAGGSIGTTEFREVGVELTVTPHITREGKIRLNIRPKFSVQTGATGGANNQPIVAKREAYTTALIQDSTTVVIGGLKKNDLSTRTNKVPLLGDLPVLGGLFKFDSEQRVNSELVVFITPYIVTEPEMTPHEKMRFDDSEPEIPANPKSKIEKMDAKKS